MGRLDDIIERNRNPKRSEKTTISIGVGIFLLLIILLMTLTDLGLPASDRAPPTASPGSADTPGSGEKRVHDVKLR